MGPKYEFTREIKKYYDYILHRIRRLSDGKLGGWIESEENLSQEGNCWVDDEAIVCNDAKVYGNAKVYDNAKITWKSEVYEDAKVYGDAWISRAKIHGNAKVYGDAQAYTCAKVYGDAEVYGNAYICDVDVYGNAKIYDNAIVGSDAKVYDDAKVYGTAYVGHAKVHGNVLVHDIKISSGEYTSGEYFDKNYINEEPLANPITKVVQDFIYKVNDSNKLTTKTEYDSINEFFSEPAKNDIKLDTLVICSVNTKEPLIKLQKVEAEDKTEFKFTVEITNEDSDDFIFRSIIKSQEHLNQLIQQTVEALRQYPKFNKYADDLEEYL